MGSYLQAVLTTANGKSVMDKAERLFPGANFCDFKSTDFADWKNRVFSQVKDVYGGANNPVRTAADGVDIAMKNWSGAPNDLDLMGIVERRLETLATMMQNYTPANQINNVKAFRDSCFSEIATMALFAENASRATPRIDSPDTVISRTRVGMTCDGYIEQFGEMPITARIGEGQLPSEYWASMMNDQALSSSKENMKLHSALIKLEQSTKVDQIPAILDQLVEGIKAVATLNAGFAGKAEMVFAEAMRSDRVTPNGAYRGGPPDPRKPGGLTASELEEMKKQIVVREERRSENPEHAGPRH